MHEHARRILLLMFVSLCLISHINGQLKLKPSYGLALSKIDNTGSIDECTYYLYEDGFQTAKLNFGLEVSKSLGKTIELGFDINYNTGLVESKYDYYTCFTDGGFIWLKYKFLYLMPKIKYTYKSRIIISAGVFGGLNLKSSSYEVTFAGPWERDVQSQVNKQNIGMHFGLGFRYKKYIVNFEYLHGFSEVLEEDQLSWVQARIGYEFEFGESRK